MYPHLKDGKFETRNSINIMDSKGKAGRLEGPGPLKMPPVSTAVAQRRHKKLNVNESFGLTTKGKQNSLTTAAQSGPLKSTEITNISESQKRIRAIVDKNADRSITSTGSNDGIDAIGSFTIKQPNTHRDLKSLDGMGGAGVANEQPKMSSTMQNQLVLDVTDRLYNKKKIQKMRNKTSHGNKEKGKKGQKHQHLDKVVSPKNKDKDPHGNEYLAHASRFAQKEKHSQAHEKASLHSTGHGAPGKQKRQQIPHNNATTSLERHSFQKLNAAK